VSVFQKIKKIYRNYFFKKRLKKVARQKKVINYFDAKNIGLLYDASIEENYLQITDLTRQLQKDGKKVISLGFVRQKKRPDYCFPKLIFGFFSARDFTWNYKPKINFVDTFINKEMDIIIDFSPDDIFHTKFISGLSKATYKIGIYSKEYYHLYDLLIDVNYQTSSLEEIIEHTMHYLKTINTIKANE